jgi:hypothetical protein
MKSFGSHTPKPPVREPFQLKYLSEDGEPRVFDGQVAAVANGAALTSVMHSLRTDNDDAVDRIMNLLLRQMDDKDGLVSVKWQPIELAKPVDLDDDELAEFEPSYRGPDGEIYPFSDAEKLDSWKDPSRWSTRRRWLHLMREDDDAVIDVDDLIKVLEWAIGLASERPTPPRT